MFRFPRSVSSMGWERVVVGLGALYVVLAGGQVALATATGESLAEALIDFVLVGGPGIILLYVGHRLPKTDLHPETYPRIIAWCLGGFGSLLVVVCLLVLNPSVTVDHLLWTLALATGIGAVGGFAIGANESRAVTQAYETERRNRELTRYETLIEEATDVNAVLDPDGTLRYLTPSVEHVLGYAPDELVGRNALSYVHPDDRQHVRERFVRTIDEPNRRTTAEFRFERDDGSWVVLEARNRNLLDDPLIGGVVAYTREVTDRKRLEDNLTALNSLTRELMEVETAEEVSDRVIETAETTLDLPCAAIGLRDERGEAVRTVVETEAASEVLRADSLLRDEDGVVRKAVEKGIPRRVTDVPGAADGSTAPTVTEVAVFPLGSHGAFVTASAATGGLSPPAFDFAETVAANTEAALDRAEREGELQRQNDRLESFASMLAHELRNPLSIAKGYLAFVTEGDEAAADEVATALDRIEEMINVLLVTARGADLTVERETVALSAVAADAWTKRAASAATLLVETEREVEADPVHLRHLLENLFRNAAEHGGEEVTVRVGDLPTGFYVEDDGGGIPETARRSVFDAGYTTETGGIGLGLTFVARLVDAYDWNCTVAESESGGARFEFTAVDSPGRRNDE
ncbi:PAS domain S-box protein [Haladaptatus salinisoli]|uniref:PAS domain S-box protein n=1 Tax=Haladaptatus salinisoli TaxID=2884876 RepID=UPI001D0B6EF5|nr:PAS domain S-box protein [Haladaptatus salinisoli]